jgi:hypothetical protein
MVGRVEVRPDEQFTARFLKELCARITVYTKDQRVLMKEHIGYEGGIDNPMSWGPRRREVPLVERSFRRRRSQKQDRPGCAATRCPVDLGSDVSARAGSPDRGLSENSSRHSMICFWSDERERQDESMA